MSAVKNLFFDELQRSVAPALPSAFPASGHPTPTALPPRFVFILTMNGKPLSVYANEPTALRDLTLMQEGDKRDGLSERYQSTYAVKLMRVDYTS